MCDDQGQLKSKTDPNVQEYSYEYDKAASLLSVTDLRCYKVVYSYDLANRKMKVALDEDVKKNYECDSAGNFGSAEIYRVIKEDFENSGIIDAIWFTLEQRQETKLPLSSVTIYPTGGDENVLFGFEQERSV